jgi:DNA-binding CsgD family transcriptional regulator
MGKSETISGKGLTRKQLEVIVLMLEEHSISTAARKAGIGKSTVFLSDVTP